MKYKANKATKIKLNNHPLVPHHNGDSYNYVLKALWDKLHCFFHSDRENIPSKTAEILVSQTQQRSTFIELEIHLCIFADTVNVISYPQVKIYDLKIMHSY